MKLVKNKGIKRILRFFMLSKEERTMVFWTVFHVCLVKLKVRFVPLRYYYHHYFAESDHEFMQPNLSDIGSIYRIMQKLRFKLSCLEESMIAKSYLRKQGMNVNINLGLRIDNDIKAHAWILPVDNLEYKKIN